ncbi:unnamed protein product [Lymnaea stagnalis]|uniref:G-protein coupled receptors family 1 profile domain-containing protein n=1 Tax=Lymnaea stagnalis TaxID=6523 RepID=A0AAV2I3Y0_LYMST
MPRSTGHTKYRFFINLDVSVRTGRTVFTMSLTLVSQATAMLLANSTKIPLPIPIAPVATLNVIGLLHYDLQTTLTRILNGVVHIGVDICGIVTNIINIIVFVRVGLVDSVTITLFSLAVSDVWFLVFYIILQVNYMLTVVLGLEPYVRLTTLSYLIAWYMNLFNDISILITVFTAVQKSACVAIPLLFKNVFTRLRVTAVILGIYGAMVVYYLPTFVSQGFKQYFDVALNRTRLGYTSQPYRNLLSEIYKIFNRMFLPFTSQVVIIICMFIMSYRLKQASLLRHKMTGDKDGGDREAGMDKVMMNPKEIRAIQVVNLVSAIFVVCNLPDIFIFFCSIYYPEFNDYGKYEISFKLAQAIQKLLTVISATVNVVVYYKFNTKYRNTFNEMLKVMFHPSQSSGKEKSFHK